MNSDLAATICGLVLSALIASQVDYVALFSGNKTEAAKVVGALVLAFNGWLTNKK